MHIVPPEELHGRRERPDSPLAVQDAPRDGAGAVAAHQVRAEPAVPAPDGGQQRNAWCSGAGTRAGSPLWLLQGATGDVSGGPLPAKAAGVYGASCCRGMIRMQADTVATWNLRCRCSC